MQHSGMRHRVAHFFLSLAALLGGASSGNAATTLQVSPASLAFGNAAVGVTTAAKTITLTNSGSTSVVFSSIALTGGQADDFMLSSACGGSLAVGATCTLTVTFKAVSTGVKNAAVSISDSATGSPQSVALSGTGTAASGAPAVKLSAATLAFGNQAAATTSPAKTVTLTNTGTASLTLKSIALAGGQADDFALTNGCATSVAVGKSCTLSVTFTPVSAGAKAASISITDNATNSPQSVALTGTGTAASGVPTVKLSVSSLAFGSETVGLATTAKSVTLSNSGTATLALTSIALSGNQSDDFTLTNGCGSSLKSGLSCMLTVSFKPVSSGAKAAALSFTDNAAGSPQSVALSGTGVAATATPTFSPAPGSFSSAQTVSIKDTASGAVIYYTTDGSTPTTSSSRYTAPVKISSTETLSAIAVVSGSAASAVASGVYSIGLSGTGTQWTAFNASPVDGTSGGQTGIFVLPSNQLTTASPVFVTHRTSIVRIGFPESVANPYSARAAITQGAVWYSADGADGKTHLYGITLNTAGAVPTEKQISNLSLPSAESVCILGNGQTDYKDSTTAWVMLDIPGTKGCGQASDKVVVVHYTDSASATPVATPLSATATNSDYVADIIGPSFVSQGILALNTQTSVLSYYKDTTFTNPTAVLSGITSVQSFAGFTSNHYWVVQDSSAHSTIYAIEAPGTAKKIYTEKSLLSDSVQDLTNYYFLDGSTLYKASLAGSTPGVLFTGNSSGIPELVGTDGTSVVMTETATSAANSIQAGYSVFSVPTASASSTAKTIFGPFASNNLVNYQVRMPEAFFSSFTSIDLLYITRTTTAISGSGTVSVAYASEIFSPQGVIKQALTSNSAASFVSAEQPVFEVQGITDTSGAEGGGTIYSFSPSTLAKTALTVSGQVYHVSKGSFIEPVLFANGAKQGVIYLANATAADQTSLGLFDLNAATIKVLSITNTDISPSF